MLRGADVILQVVEETTCCCVGSVSPDCLFGVDTVQCQGACVNAPVVVVDDDYYVRIISLICTQEIFFCVFTNVKNSTVIYLFSFSLLCNIFLNCSRDARRWHTFFLLAFVLVCCVCVSGPLSVRSLLLFT